MPRVKGSGNAGAVRSLRLPKELDAWFEELLMARPEQSASELLLELVHGGLRLRYGYMRAQREQVEKLIAAGDSIALKAYVQALNDTFGPAYVHHLRQWLEADGIVVEAQNRVPFL